MTRRTKHDLNNLIMVVTGCLEIAEMTWKKDPTKAWQMLERVRGGAEDIAAYAKQLPTLAGVPAKDSHRLDLPPAVDRWVNEHRALLGGGIALTLEAAGEPLVIDLEDERLQHVLDALVTNAVEALPQGGEVRVRVRRDQVGSAPERSDLEPGHYAVLEVSDQGQGMDADVRARLFEPFFTTKRGEERGFGLATVYGVARQAKGAVWIESEPDRGTTVIVHLPLLEVPAAAAPPLAPSNASVAAPAEMAIPAEAPVPSPAAAGDDTVLLVDDDATVREVVHDVLLDAGYSVLVAATGPAALEIAEAYGGPIALLLTDVIMPEMDGLELASRFLELRPDARLLFMSGYAEEVLRSVGEGALVPFLPKPFPPDVLRTKLAEILRRR